MSKKHKRVAPKYVPTKRQLSKWQRQARIRRIIIITAAVFLAGIIGYVGYGYYNDKIKPLHQTVIEVNDASFTMSYYVNMLESYSKLVEPSQIPNLADFAANQITQDELIRQGANSLEIQVTPQEIDEKIEESELPHERVYTDAIAAGLLREKLQEYFSSQLPATMEQAHTQVMLVESQEAADEVMTKIENGANFTALVEEFSCNNQTVGDLGWLPRELMPNSLIADATFSPDSGKINRIKDGPITKNTGYWLIEVTDKDEEQGIKARAILLGSKQEADEVKAELSHDNLAELANEHSQYENGEGGGELGWLKEGDMNSASFDEAAFNLPIDEISEPVQDKSVQTTGGYWVVNVLEKGEHNISEEVSKRLANNKFMEWFQEQKESSTINNYLDEEKKSWAVNRVLSGR